ncbi:glycoside hydrolase family 16 protein [Novosphingobium gossypii]|uniref:glycoside hydrolase family 16 protein n=1 Tax=Novosphingobium gossypii TaxID=1604774 RepID=UPI003D19463B
MKWIVLLLAATVAAAVMIQSVSAEPDASLPDFSQLGTPSFDERFRAFDHGTDQTRPRNPHRWRTVYGHGGAGSIANRQMSAGSFAADPEFAGVARSGAGRRTLGLNPFQHRPGQLTILARKTPETLRPLAWDKPYYGGAITTKFSFAQKYGYFEIEAKLPVGKGMWPAFWLMPAGGNWPGDGEIDVVEGLGNPRTIFCTVIAGKHKQSLRVRLAFDASAGFHRYGVLWSERELMWFVDRKVVARAPTPAALTTQPAYMIANLAVGGSWGGYPDGGTAWPGEYAIRRVTVWPYPLS